MTLSPSCSSVVAEHGVGGHGAAHPDHGRSPAHDLVDAGGGDARRVGLPQRPLFGVLVMASRPWLMALRVVSLPATTSRMKNGGHLGVGERLAVDVRVDQGGGDVLGRVLPAVGGQVEHQQVELLRRGHERDHRVVASAHVLGVAVGEDDVRRVEDRVVVGGADAHHVADDLERQPGRHLDHEVAATRGRPPGR